MKTQSTATKKQAVTYYVKCKAEKGYWIAQVMGTEVPEIKAGSLDDVLVQVKEELGGQYDSLILMIPKVQTC